LMNWISEQMIKLLEFISIAEAVLIRLGALVLVVILIAKLIGHELHP
jgi:hypothetical protein